MGKEDVQKIVLRFVQAVHKNEGTGEKGVREGRKRRMTKKGEVVK